MQELIDRAAQLNAQKKKIEDELDSIKKKIKANGEGVYAGNKYQAIVTTRTTKSLNQDKAVEVARSLGAKWLLKEVVDEAKLEDSLSSGELPAKAFKNCVVSKNTTAITFKEVAK